MLRGTGAAQDQPAPTLPSKQVSLQFVTPYKQPDYDASILRPIHAAQKAAQTHCNAPGDVLRGYTCIIPIPPVTPSPESPQTLRVTGDVGTGTDEPQVGGLIGSVGYSLAGGNCVDIGGINNPGYGNPIDWPVLTSTPHIGATVLFTWNHTARVVGIYADGSIEVAQENAPGMAHHIPPSQVRGYR